MLKRENKIVNGNLLLLIYTVNWYNPTDNCTGEKINKKKHLIIKEITKETIMAEITFLCSIVTNNSHRVEKPNQSELTIDLVLKYVSLW